MIVGVIGGAFIVIVTAAGWLLVLFRFLAVSCLLQTGSINYGVENITDCKAIHQTKSSFVFVTLRTSQVARIQPDESHS